MPKKPKLTKKDSYILMIGVLLGFLLQIGYDVAHEFASFGIEPINWYWIFVQFCFLVLIGLLAYLVLGEVEQQ